MLKSEIVDEELLGLMLYDVLRRAGALEPESEAENEIQNQSESYTDSDSFGSADSEAAALPNPDLEAQDKMLPSTQQSLAPPL